MKHTLESLQANLKTHAATTNWLEQQLNLVEVEMESGEASDVRLSELNAMVDDITNRCNREIEIGKNLIVAVKALKFNRE